MLCVCVCSYVCGVVCAVCGIEGGMDAHFTNLSAFDSLKVNLNSYPVSM